MYIFNNDKDKESRNENGAQCTEGAIFEGN